MAVLAHSIPESANSKRKSSTCSAKGGKSNSNSDQAAPLPSIKITARQILQLGLPC